MVTLSNQLHNQLQDKAKIARGAILSSTTLAGSGHPGGSMSSIDILLSLYAYANINPQNRTDDSRDRIVISNGHISPAVYSTLALNKFFPIDDFISQFRLGGSIFEGHVERDTPGVEWGSGNLGQGLSAACGFALASKLKNINNHIYVLMGDGEQQKGQLSEARRFAVKYGLKNITAFIDFNRLQIGGNIDEIMPQQIKENYVSDGWKVIEIDGHSFPETFSAINDAAANESPTLVLANTVMGKGVSFMENKEQYHGAAIKPEQLADALNELGLDNHFQRYQELRNSFVPELKCGLDAHSPIPKTTTPKLNTGTPRTYSKPLDNRSAWGNALADVAAANKNSSFTPIAVFDCDLQGSVKTKDFEQVLPQNFFQCGISEHHAATTSGALSIENIQTFFADFGVFGIDETYNQQRLNDINHTNLKLIVTHVGLDVGEDGKTHQCVDYVGLMRNLYHFKIIVPVCPNQTDRIIRYISTQAGNFVVAMGRSKMNVLTKEDGSIFYDENYSFSYGKADLIRDGQDGALFVMGSVAVKALEVVDNLRDKGIKLQLWAAACPQHIEKEVLEKAAQTGRIFTYEDHNIHTGLGCIVSNLLHQHNINCRLHKIGTQGYCLSGKSEDVYRLSGLDIDSVTTKIENVLAE